MSPAIACSMGVVWAMRLFFDHVEDRRPPQRSHVERFIDHPFAQGAIAQEGDHHCSAAL